MILREDVARLSKTRAENARAHNARIVRGAHQSTAKALETETAPQRFARLVRETHTAGKLSETRADKLGAAPTTTLSLWKRSSI